MKSVLKLTRYVYTNLYFKRKKSTFESQKIGVIGVPFHKGQRKDGVDKGPEVLRNGGLLTELLKLGHNVKDYGNILYEKTENSSNSFPMANSMINLEEIAACNHKLSDKVYEILEVGSKVITLGGDHSVVVGSADGHIRSKKDISLLYIDAHTDLNTAHTSSTGNVHGMAVALLVKELEDYWPYLPGMDWQKPVLSVKNLAFIGLRSVDNYERLMLDKFNISAFGMEDVDKYGIHKVTEMALNSIDPDGTRSLHVSFDIDSLDSLEAPCTGVPVRGGLTLREAISIMEVVHLTKRLYALDIVEINPLIGTMNDVKKTVEAATHVAMAGFGSSRLGNSESHVKDIPGFYTSFMKK
uniref:Arginase n=2 Tax=Clastoptera arizonana TaxID=38151 RepID=A0A1B6CW41_9HEMI